MPSEFSSQIPHTASNFPENINIKRLFDFRVAFTSFQVDKTALVVFLRVSWVELEFTCCTRFKNRNQIYHTIWPETELVLAQLTVVFNLWEVKSIRLKLDRK